MGLLMCLKLNPPLQEGWHSHRGEGVQPLLMPTPGQPRGQAGRREKRGCESQELGQEKLSPAQRAPTPQQGCHRLGRNYLLLQGLPSPAGSAFLSSRPPPASAAPGSERCLWPTAERESWEWEQQDQNQRLRAEGWFLPAPPATETVSCPWTALLELNSPDSVQLP